MAQEELKACRLMLDMGVAIPVRPLKYLHRKKKPCRIIMRTPYAGTIMRIDRLYLSLGVTYEERRNTLTSRMPILYQNMEKQSAAW